MSIYTFGDSHSVFGWNEKVNRNNIGPYLCFTFGKYRLNLCNIKNYGVKDNDVVVFSFGEIDCRCHIHKHISDIKSYQEIIDELVFNYIEAVKENVIGMNVKVGIYNIVPPIKKETVEENPHYPFLGSDEERKAYTTYFNLKLKEKCIENNYIFIDIYDKYIDDEGFLNKELSDGCVHIKNGIFLDNFIRKNIKSDL
jgi:hypothetical protein